LPFTLFFEDSKGRVERLNHQKMNYQILKKMNRITERTRVPFASLWVNCATGDAQGFAAGPIIP
jgi:hypothetical protein